MDLPAIAVIGTALSAARIEAQFSALALTMQMESVQQLGQNAVHLIKAASLDPAVGQYIDIRV